MAGCRSRRRGAHTFWNLAVANPTTLEHLGLDRTDRPDRWPRTLLRDLGPPPGIGCGVGPFFVSANYLYVCAGMVGVWQCARLGCCFGGLRGGGEWVVFIMEGGWGTIDSWAQVPNASR